MLSKWLNSQFACVLSNDATVQASAVRLDPFQIRPSRLDDFINYIMSSVIDCYLHDGLLIFGKNTVAIDQQPKHRSSILLSLSHSNVT